VTVSIQSHAFVFGYRSGKSKHVGLLHGIHPLTEPSNRWTYPTADGFEDDCEHYHMPGAKSRGVCPALSARAQFTPAAFRPLHRCRSVHAKD
jgi:hypothetical protein